MLKHEYFFSKTVINLICYRKNKDIVILLENMCFALRIMLCSHLGTLASKRLKAVANGYNTSL